jgi:hypothetical protein
MFIITINHRRGSHTLHTQPLPMSIYLYNTLLISPRLLFSTNPGQRKRLHTSQFVLFTYYTYNNTFKKYHSKSVRLAHNQTAIATLLTS